jgi:Icc-related predicted phosphoesterase
MKLVHATDLHGHKPWFDQIADQAKGYDLVACSGDFLDMFGPEPLASQARWVRKWGRNLPVLAAPGNHDCEIEGTNSLPGIAAFGPSGQVERSGQTFIQVGWKGVIPNLGAGAIVLAHAPPAGCLTARAPDGPDRGDLDLGDAIRSAKMPPWLVLSGHVHNPARWWDRCGRTISLNPGMTKGTKAPNFITVDTVAKKVRWFRDGELADAILL